MILRQRTRYDLRLKSIKLSLIMLSSALKELLLLIIEPRALALHR
jgi:hypothetical protein